jgi:hypothetical protein
VPPPPLTAADSLYRSTARYASISPQDAGLSRWGGDTTCDVIYGDCVSAAQSTHKFRTNVCSQLGGPSATVQRCNQIADADFQSDLASCRQQFLCATAADCKQSPVGPHGFRCCPPGTQACGTGSVPDCVPECPPRKLIPINASSCTCVCDPLLQECELTSAGFQKIRDPTTCVCVCPPVSCTGGKVQNPNTCLCECPPGWTECKGAGCRNLSNDRFHCGDCGNACAPDEDCCNGNCEKLNTEPNCGYCGAACSPWGQTCCVTPLGAAKGHCADLKTSQDCGSCGNACKANEKCCPGASKWDPYKCVDVLSSPAHCGTCTTKCSSTKICINGSCVCPSGQVDCGGECCVPSRCCANKCVDLNTDRDNCGGCGLKCEESTYNPTTNTVSVWPGTCQGGKCVCPTDMYLCGTVRCLHTQYFPVCCPPSAAIPYRYYGCPAGTTCCSTGCCV